MQNIQDQLEKFRLLSFYSTKKTLSENISSKAKFSSPEEEIRYAIAGAVLGTFGTNEKRLVDALNKINNATQFSEIEKIMSQNPIKGQKTIESLLNQELESDDANTFSDIKKILEPKGINLTATVDQSGRLLEPKTIKITLSTPKKDEVITASGTSPEKQQHINNMWCSLKNGIITAGGRFSGKKWGEYTNAVGNITNQEIEIAKKSCSGTPNKPITDKRTVSFRSNEKFPLKFMDSGEKVKQLQTALGVKNRAGQPNITGKFYTATEALVKPKAQELGIIYNRENGVSEDLFNEILRSNPNPTNDPNRPNRELEQPITIDRKRPDLNVPNKLPGTVPSVTGLQNQTTPEQYYKQLVSLGLIDSLEQGGDRIVYRGQKPDKKVEDYANQYLSSLGYQQTRERSPNNKDKLITVWKK